MADAGSAGDGTTGADGFAIAGRVLRSRLILGALATRLIRCIGKVRLGVEGDEVHHSVVERVPEVLKALGGLRRHANK